MHRWAVRSLGVVVAVAACSDDGLAPQDGTGGLAGTAEQDGDEGDDAAGDDGATGGDGANGSSGGIDDDTTAGTSTDGGLDPDAAYCPDVEPWPKTQMLCLSQADCPPDYSCDPNGPSDPGCGACFGPDIPCTSDEQCIELRLVCAPVVGRCLCDPGALGCTAPCTEGSCEDDQVCQPDGHCVPISCEDGWACDASSETCDPAAANADAHGCAAIACDDGWRCARGFACDAAAGVADVHGCAPIHCSEAGGVQCEPNFHCDEAVIGTGCSIDTCTMARDCDCGSCVEGVCRSAPGVCVPPPPP